MKIKEVHFVNQQTVGGNKLISARCGVVEIATIFEDIKLSRSDDVENIQWYVRPNTILDHSYNSENLTSIDLWDRRLRVYNTENQAKEAIVNAFGKLMNLFTEE